MMNPVLFNLLIPGMSGVVGLIIGYFISGYVRKASGSTHEQPSSLLNDNQANQQVPEPVTKLTPDPKAVIELDAADPQANLSPEQIRKLLREVGSVTETVRSDVGRHSIEMQKLNSNLSDSLDNSSKTLCATIEKLIEANSSLESRLEDAESKLHEQSDIIAINLKEARTDSLTGLANRREFDDTLRKQIQIFQRTHRTTSLLMLDIDHFKRLNDTYGHLVGDEILSRIGVMLDEMFETTNAIPARYGGEEFAVVLPGTELFDAKVTAARILKRIQKMSVRSGDQCIQFTCSLGVAQLAEKDDYSSIVRRTDSALYAAKSAGRNKAYWHDGEIEQPLNIERLNTDNKSKKQNSEEHQKRIDESKETGNPLDSASEIEAAFLINASPERSEFYNDLERRLNFAKRSGEPLSLVMISIDQQPEIEANHSDKAMTLVQNVMRQLLSAVLRDSDHVCKIDNQRYGVLLPESAIVDASVIAERLRKAVGKVELKSAKGPITFTISAGVTQALGVDDPVDVLVRVAQGLKRSIARGGNEMTAINKDSAELSHAKI